MKHTEVSYCFKVVLFIQEIQEMFTLFLLRCVIEYFIHFIVGVGRTRFNTVQTFYFFIPRQATKVCYHWYIFGLHLQT